MELKKTLDEWKKRKESQTRTQGCKNSACHQDITALCCSENKRHLGIVNTRIPFRYVLAEFLKGLEAISGQGL